MQASNSCYRIRGGVVTVTEIPVDGCKIPIYRDEIKNVQPVALPGREHDDWTFYTIGQVAAIATTMTPWATWWCTPNKTGRKVGDVGEHIGIAHIRQSSVWLTTNMEPCVAVTTALHETFHIAEDYLTLQEMQTLNRGIISAPCLPDSERNRYLTSGSEVRANAFESWAYSHWLRGRMPEYRRGMPADERIWTLIFRGDLGLRVARRGLIRRDRMPAALAARLAERSTLQLAYDYVRHAAIAAWKGLGAAARWVADAFVPQTPAQVTAPQPATASKPSGQRQLGGRPPSTPRATVSRPSS